MCHDLLPDKLKRIFFLEEIHFNIFLFCLQYNSIVSTDLASDLAS